MSGVHNHRRLTDRPATHTAAHRSGALDPGRRLVLNHTTLWQSTMHHMSTYSSCSRKCGKGVMKRAVACVSSGSYSRVLPDASCAALPKPSSQETCVIKRCHKQRKAHWDMGVWSECSVSCGWGVQQRHIQCRQSFGNRSTMVHPQRCASLTRPNATQPCHPRVCSHWEISTNWSTCSRSCGEGVQTREVRCLTADKQHNTACDLDSKPAHERSCNTIPCSPFEDENCKDRRHNCVMVVQARLCVYSYYKTACCASCTQSAQRAKRH
uniref:ADAM metallopeptidase with thrombospondin type 1 motif 16 n=1 Tax=Sinocyclocheilus grahami TaxID=75366 RepID=A0A672LAI0_SINGR